MYIHFICIFQNTRKISVFLFENNVLTEAKNGFSKNISTDTAIQTSIESIKEASDRGLHAIGLLFDLSKVYDVINGLEIQKYDCRDLSH
jgi:hypothetical protein